MYFSFIILALLICFSAPRSSIQPACALFMFVFAVDLSLANIILSNTLLHWLIRLIVLLLLQCLVFPFFGNEIIIDSIHESGHSLYSSIMLLILFRMSTTGAPPAFTSSAVMLSVPGDLVFFNVLMTVIT